MIQVFSVNNWSTTITQALSDSGLEIHVPEEDAARVLLPTYLSIENEIVKVSGRKQASCGVGTNGVNRITFTAVAGGSELNGLGVTITAAEASQPLEVTLDEEDGLIIRPAGDAQGVITSTVNDVLLGINNHVPLSSAIQASSPTLGALVTAGTAVMAGGDDEILTVTHRGVQGTVAASHSVGSVIEMRLTAGHLEIIRQLMCSVSLDPCLVACEGAPGHETLSLGEDQPSVAAWRFEHSTAQSVSGLVALPIAFVGGLYPKAVMLTFAFPEDAQAGNARFTFRAKPLGGFESSPWHDATPFTVAASGQACNVVDGGCIVVLPDMANVSGVKKVLFEITRTPEHEDDTLAADACLISANLLEVAPELYQ